LDEGQVRAELTAAASAVGLGEREIQQTLDAQWRRKQGVTRPGWNSSGPSQDHLGLHRTMMMLAPALSDRSPGFGR
jgi:hypothetical protein